MRRLIRACAYAALLTVATLCLLIGMITGPYLVTYVYGWLWSTFAAAAAGGELP